MVSIATLGVMMMGGMGIGVFTNAGLSHNEIKEKCQMLKELEDEIDKVKSQTSSILEGFHKDHEEMVRIVNDSKSGMNSLVDKIIEMKDNNQKALNREEYIYTSVIITIIVIILFKMILSIFLKENIK